MTSIRFDRDDTLPLDELQRRSWVGVAVACALGITSQLAFAWIDERVLPGSAMARLRVVHALVIGIGLGALRARLISGAATCAGSGWFAPPGRATRVVQARR